jgi:hypothetical protein
MKFLLLSFFFLLVFSACASKPKYDEAMLEKYPQCYHINMKIYNKCIRDNESGKKTSALEIENRGIPIQ